MRKENQKRANVSENPEQLKYSVGIDIGKESFAVCLCVIDQLQSVKILGSRNFDNTPSGFKNLDYWIQKKQKLPLDLRINMEATGVYYESVAWYLHDHGYNISVTLPNRAKRYLQAIGAKSKNDKADAAGLARMGAEQNLTLWIPPEESLMSLRSLTRQRQQIQESITMFRNQREAHLFSEHQHPSVIKHLNQILKTLEKTLEKLDVSLLETINNDPELNQKVGRITQIKGVGWLTVITILAETGAFHMIRNQSQLVSYAGYDIVENQSGRHIGKTRISKKGNARIRRILHMPAFSVVTCQEPMFKALYDRVYDRSKIKMKAYVAVQRKLLVVIYALWKNEQNYQSKLTE